MQKMFKIDLEALMGPYEHVLGQHYIPYLNHVNRLVRLTFALKQENKDDDRDKIVIAAVFHDIGIWSAKTFDYLDPSIAEAKKYLQKIDKLEWLEEIGLIIAMHHKLSVYHGKFRDNVEAFRRADLVDVTKGLKRFGLPKHIIRENYWDFPAEGFQKLLVKFFIKRLLRHPFSPLPMLKR